VGVQSGKGSAGKRRPRGAGWAQTAGRKKKKKKEGYREGMGKKKSRTAKKMGKTKQEKGDKESHGKNCWKERGEKENQLPKTGVGLCKKKELTKILEKKQRRGKRKDVSERSRNNTNGAG